MRGMFRRTRREIPALNTSSLPDLIFVVLFFFMIVTHMREVQMKVDYQVPQGEELERLTRKSAVSYIFIGRPTPELQRTMGTETRIQLNDKFATIDDVAAFVKTERQHMSPDDAPRMTVSIKADRHTRMGLITDVKQALRQQYALRINYSATPQE